MKKQQYQPEHKTMKFSLKGVKYEMPAGEFDKYYVRACDEHRMEYMRLQKEELDDARMQIADGFISSIEEYDEGDHLEPYDIEAHRADIDALAYEMYRCEKELPKNIVVEVQSQSSDLSREAILTIANAHTQAMYGESVKDMSLYRRASVKDIANYNVYKSFMNLRHSKDFHSFLTFTNNISGTYSFNNRMLIYGQKANATFVKGYHAWREKFNRGVSKGATRIEITSPVIKEFKSAEDVRKYEAKYSLTSAEKKRLLAEIEKNGSATLLSYYVPNYVYDITDTYALDPENDKYKELTEGKKVFTGDNLKEVYDLVLKTAEKYAVKMSVREYDGKADCVYDNVHALVDSVLKTCPDEVVGIKTMDILHGEEHNLETLIAVGIVCSHLGIEADKAINYGITKSLDSIEFLRKDKQKIFENTFQRGFLMASDFTKEFDMQ